jgi:hypothetical protein
MDKLCSTLNSIIGGSNLSSDYKKELSLSFGCCLEYHSFRQEVVDNNWSIRNDSECQVSSFTAEESQEKLWLTCDRVTS